MTTLWAIVDKDGISICIGGASAYDAWCDARNIRCESVDYLVGRGCKCIELNTYDPSKQVVIDREVYDFLHGVGGIENCHFGDNHPTLKGRFWWRKFLSAGEVKK